MDIRFDGQAVLVTGATSGIGAAAARGFAEAGARLLLTGRSRERGAAVAAEIEEAGGAATFVAGDLRQAAVCESLVAQAVERLGRLDVLVNGAGVIHRATADRTSDAQWRETMAANVDAVFFLCRAAVPAMKRQGGGVIVNVASDAALIGAPAMAAYCASKGAVLQMTRAMALDHGADGIRVVAVCPDNVDTPMLESEAAQLGEDYAAYVKAAGANLPLGRIATAREVADAILFLASDKAGFVTGSGFVLDGGYTAG